MPTLTSHVSQPSPSAPFQRDAEPAGTLSILLDTIARLERRVADLEERARLRRACTPTRDLHIDY